MYINVDLLFDSWHLRDWQIPCEQCDAVFVLGRAEGDWEVNDGDEGLLCLAAWVWHRNIAHCVVIPGTDGSRQGGKSSGDLIPTGYPGWKVWRKIWF